MNRRLRRSSERPRWVARALAVALLLAGSPWAGAQRSAEAQRLLDQARETAREARVAYADYPIFTFDQPLWRRAIDLGGDALELAPDDPEVLRFLSRAYSYVDWYVRAWRFWQTFLEAGGSLDDAAAGLDPDEPSSADLFAEAGTELGFSRYAAGDPDTALGYYQAVAAQLPDDLEALTWLGRIHFESGRPDEALPYWERLVELAPDDEGARYYLARTRERLAVGVAASDSFQRGIGAYDAGRFEEALGHFEEALEANGDFAEAAVWAGRTSLELGRSDAAGRYWRRVLELDPDDTRAAYFLEVAEAQGRWGVDAARAFYQGQAHYSVNALEEAANAFVSAARANPEYLDAWVWAGRSLQELGLPEDAIVYWRGVLRIDPNDARARHFIRVAEQQLAYGVEAGAAYVGANDSYQQARFEEAEQGFRRAVDANPRFAAAWGGLGRVYFAQARYAEAAESYGRAAALEPGNEDYAFFAEEARRLAGE